MPDHVDGEDEFPGARWQHHEVSAMVTNLMERFTARDQRITLRDALVFRRTTDEHATGQYVPAPFDKSRSIIKHATGILVDRAQHLSAKAAENAPNIQVNMLVSGKGPTPTDLDKNKRQEDAQNAIYWEAGRAYTGTMQQILAFSAITKGVGWYHSYENALGWKAPSRAFYTSLSDEEVEKLQNADAITEVFPKQGEEFRYAESLDLWERRKLDAMRENASDGESLFVIEALPPGSVYYRKDTRGISLAMIVEEIPSYEITEEFGVQEDGHGNIVIGADRGGPVQQGLTGITWLRIRVWTRDEVYYYVSRQQGGKPSGVGRIVFHSKHDYGEVPLWPAAATVTDSVLPEEEYLPLLEGAYAMIPGYNQALTLLSNAAVFNLTPRYVIIRVDGSPVMDPDTSAPLVFETPNVAGIDPEYAAIIETGGGQFQQLKIENVQDIINLVEIYGRALDQTLPPEAATGASGSEEPAWGTRLKQAAANIKIIPVVKNHAAGMTGMARFHARIIKHRRQTVVVYAKPAKRRANGRSFTARDEITLKPEDITLDISVSQRDSDAQERITKMQVGMELRFPKNGQPAIDDISFYDEWMESDDPIGDARRARAQMIVDGLMQTVMIPRIIQRVQGRLTARTPAEAQGLAEQGSAEGLPAEPAAAAGVRQPGIEESLGQKTLPDLSVPGTAPLRGEVPV